MRALSSLAAAGSAMTKGSMYNWRVQGVLNALARAGKAEGPLEVSDLTALGHLDQYHYLGTTACDHVCNLLGLCAESKVLDVGSGIGGPARYLSARTGCSVDGVELQADLSQAASELTSRVTGLSDRVGFVTGDVTDAALVQQLGPQSYDHFISLLVNLHVPDRTALLSNCSALLAPGGTFVIEDFVARRPLDGGERQVLSDLVSAPTVTSVAEYERALHAAGFVDLECSDMSGAWTQWTRARAELYAASEQETVAVHGRELFESRVAFYQAIDKLFAGGNLGGVRISGRKPSRAEAALRAGRRAVRAEGGGGEVRVVEGSGGGTEDHPATKRAAAAQAGVQAGGTRLEATQRSAAQLLDGAGSVQPRFPWREHGEALHDSLQYHFFFPGLFVAARVFHTSSLQHHSAWICELGGEAGGDGAQAGVQAGVAPAALQLHSTEMPLISGGGAGVDLAGEEMAVRDEGPGGLTLHLSPSAEGPVEALRKAGCAEGVLKVTASQRRAYGWQPAGFETEADRPVIHRPDLEARVVWRGRELQGYGYSKRYHGVYPRHNGWRFIHGVANEAGSTLPTPEGQGRASVVWTADATFGDDKYNYYKLLPDAKADASAAGLVEAKATETYQQADAGYAIIDGVRHQATLAELAKWSAIIGGGGGMECKMENRLCALTLSTGEGPPLTGLAYNERCFGTLW